MQPNQHNQPPRPYGQQQQHPPRSMPGGNPMQFPPRSAPPNNNMMMGGPGVGGNTGPPQSMPGGRNSFHGGPPPPIGSQQPTMRPPPASTNYAPPPSGGMMMGRGAPAARGPPGPPPPPMSNTPRGGPPMMQQQPYSNMGGPPQSGAPPSMGGYQTQPPPRGQYTPSPRGPGPAPPQSIHPPMTGMPPQQQPQPGYGAPRPRGVGGGVSAPATPGRDPRQRIDPSQIPRPPAQHEVIRYHARGHTMTMPPNASAQYIVHDDGCCSPRFIRPTLNHVPMTKELAKQCGIPLAAVIAPLAELRPEEDSVPQVDFGPEGPLRCTRCKGYISCYSRFVQGGRKYICTLCGMSNETPREYYCNVDEHGRRRDAFERPELCKGSVEFIVPEGYTVRPPQQPVYVYVLDVSLFAIKTGLLQASISALKESLEEIPEPESAKIGIVTFDRQVHYYSMDAAFDTPRMIVCPNVNDPFAPIPASKWLAPLLTCREKIDMVCDLIVSLFQESIVPDAAVGSALSSVVETLAETGGRILLCQSSLATVGVGKVSREENQSFYGTDKELPMYTADPKDKFYKDLADKCAALQVTVDMFLCGKLYTDLATVSQVCKATAGSVHFAPYFGKNETEDRLQLEREMVRAVKRTLGFEAVLKVRCSTGLRVAEHYGHFMNRSGLDVEIAGVDVDKAIVVTLEHDDDLVEGTDVHIQVALLYTTMQGKRCVRVHNLALQVAPILSNVFRYADLEATCAVYQRQACKLMLDKTSVETRDQMVDACVNVLYNYRKHCATSSSSGQLILPESLKLLPLYTLATLKSVAVRSNLTGSRGIVDVRADERAVMLNLFESLPVEHAVFAVYPRLYALHEMPDDAGSIGDDSRLKMPPLLPPTAEKLTGDGIYLLVNATSMQIYITPNADKEQLTELFGTPEVDTSEKVVNFSDSTSSELKDRILAILDEIRETSPVKQSLEVITKSDWRCNRFMNNLVEDRTKNDMSYVEFLCQLHKKIQARSQ